MQLSAYQESTIYANERGHIEKRRERDGGFYVKFKYMLRPI